jgi:hypothetical protein
MPITFTCSCGEKIEVDDDMAGRQVRCPYCEGIADVPVAAARPTPRRARPVEPEDTDDDHGAYSGSLNPLDRSNRRPSRRRKGDDDDDDDRPSRRAYDDDDDDDDDRRGRRRRRRAEPPPYKLFNKQVVGGAVCIFIGVVVTGLLAYFFEGVACWFIILIIAGFISLIRGLVTGRDN